MVLRTSFIPTLFLGFLSCALGSSLLPSAFNGTCFGCIANGYKYCPESATCVLVNFTCAGGRFYSNSTGCPVV